MQKEKTKGKKSGEFQVVNSTQFPGEELYRNPSRLLGPPGGQASLWILEKKKDKTQKVLLKLYHHGMAPNKMALSKIAKLAHPHIIPILDTGTWNDQHYEITPWIQTGNLRATMKGNINGKLPSTLDNSWPDWLAKQILEQTGSALQTLHKNGIFHGDLKPENILIQSVDHEKEKISVLLTDFGSSKPSDASLLLTQIAASPLYISPETATGNPGSKSDYYSLGVMLLEGLLGYHPLAHLSPQQIFFTMASGKGIPKFNSSSKIPSHWKKVLKNLTHKNPKKRTLLGNFPESKNPTGLFRKIWEICKKILFPPNRVNTPKEQRKQCHTRLDKTGYSYDYSYDHTLLNRLNNLAYTSHLSYAEHRQDSKELENYDITLSNLRFLKEFKVLGKKMDYEYNDFPKFSNKLRDKLRDKFEGF